MADPDMLEMMAAVVGEPDVAALDERAFRYSWTPRQTARLPLSTDRIVTFMRRHLTEHRAMYNMLALVAGPAETLPFGTKVYQAIKRGNQHEARRLLLEAEANPPYTDPRSMVWLRLMRLLHAPRGLVHPASRVGRARRAQRRL